METITGKSVRPTYKNSQPDAVIRDRKEEYEYHKYRENYKKAVGVYPEFDCINNPSCAVALSQVIYPDDLDAEMKKNTKKGWLQLLTAGIRGGFAAVDHGKAPWQRGISVANDYIPGETANLASIASGKNDKLYPLFKKLFKSTIAKYKFFYSALSCVDCDELEKIEAGDYISSEGLGYRKLESGAYAEGTWINGTFSYGMTYGSEYGLTAGYYKDERLAEGVWIDNNGVCHIGKFDEEGKLEGESCIRIFKLYEPTSDLLGFIQTGSFSHGVADGFVLEFSLGKGNVVAMRDVKYYFGEEVSMSFFEKRARKKLYGSSKLDRITGYYRGFMFSVIAVVVAAMSIPYIAEGESELIIFLPIAAAFLFFGIRDFKNALTASKKAKDFNS